jgi:hypothetical protein
MTIVAEHMQEEVALNIIPDNVPEQSLHGWIYQNELDKLQKDDVHGARL